MTDMTSNPRVRMGLTERLANAWATFKVTHKVDPEALSKWLARRAARTALALKKLDGFDQALIETVRGGGVEARATFARVAQSISKLELEDQAWIAQYICRPIPAAVVWPEMRALSERVAPIVAGKGLVA